MNERDFCYWLRGFFEINQVNGQCPGFTRTQMELIDKHLKLVFTPVVTLTNPIVPIPQADYPYFTQSPIITCDSGAGGTCEKY